MELEKFVIDPQVFFAYISNSKKGGFTSYAKGDAYENWENKT